MIGRELGQVVRVLLGPHQQLDRHRLVAGMRQRIAVALCHDQGRLRSGQEHLVLDDCSADRQCRDEDSAASCSALVVALVAHSLELDMADSGPKQQI